MTILTTNRLGKTNSELMTCSSAAVCCLLIAVCLFMRLAYFSPLNPQPSGISDYSEELLPYLRGGGGDYSFR